MRNIIFDFGNVLVRWQPEVFYANLFGDEARSWFFLRHVANAEWRNTIDAGAPQAECIASLKQKFPEYAEAIECYRSKWDDMLTGEVDGMSALIDELKCMPDTAIYGLTNWSSETFPDARKRFQILQKIDHYVVSGDEGLVKPDPRLFQVLLNRYHLKPEECIFIDDNATNVASARALGMQGIVFCGAESLRMSLGLYRHLTPEEIHSLEAQGNRSGDWSEVTVASSTFAMRDCHLEGQISIGNNCVITASNLKDCTIGDNTTIERCSLISNISIGHDCNIAGVGELSFSTDGVSIAVMNENGGRSISPFKGMTVGDAYLWARFRNRNKLMQRFAQMSSCTRGSIGNHVSIRNAVALIDGIIADNCTITHGVIAERFVLGENVRLEFGLRLNDSVVGDNSTLARCEVGNSMIFPSHEQHHNNSFLIAALTMGQSNVAAGATLGSNHNGRTADGELQAGRGFWPALCSSVKHSSRFASYTLLAKADYPHELNITLPFSLVNNNTRKNQLEVMPAYWWMYNMYALHRNITKFAARDKRTLKRQHIEFSPFAPDIAEEMLVARDLIRMWTERSYKDNGATEVVAYGMERGKRRTILLKPGEAYRAYREMLIYYAISVLTKHYGSNLPPTNLGDTDRVQRWVNIGGQLIAGKDLDAMLEDIENGVLDSWQDIHNRLDALWGDYPLAKVRHAYMVLCELLQRRSIDETEWNGLLSEYRTIQQLVRDRITESRQKDANNEFRHTTYWDSAEMAAVLGE
ncbi:MAG: HAD-IA family hydrolase [Bacteroidales bacterium]|nr:HAD-IA family hydrolase [Bacteroidales bacterium]MBR1850676.1 HAD-IA family hydrolase [Bacteroidales bacterium]